ncbi:hypothetical protein GCM10029964_078900 [Kibdelosporangium lantanae]
MVGPTGRLLGWVVGPGWDGVGGGFGWWAGRAVARVGRRSWVGWCGWLFLVVGRTGRLLGWVVGPGWDGVGGCFWWWGGPGGPSGGSSVRGEIVQVVLLAVEVLARRLLKWIVDPV